MCVVIGAATAAVAAVAFDRDGSGCSAAAARTAFIPVNTCVEWNVSVLCKLKSSVFVSAETSG